MCYMKCQTYDPSYFTRLILLSTFWHKVFQLIQDWQFCDMKNTSDKFGVGCLGVLMM